MLSDCLCPMAILKHCCRCHQHRHRRQRQRNCHHHHHRCHHRRCLRHHRCCCHCRCRFNNVALSLFYCRAFWRPIGGAGPNHSSPNCPHWSIVVLDGWHSTCKRSACRCHPSPSHHCCPIVIVKLLLSNRRPRTAAVIIINIVSVGSGSGIIAVAVAVAIAISPITIVAVIINVALSTLLRHRRQNGGGKFPWYLSYVFLRRIFGKAACGWWQQCFW